MFFFSFLSNKPKPLPAIIKKHVGICAQSVDFTTLGTQKTATWEKEWLNYVVCDEC